MLTIAPDLELPDEFVTGTDAMLARRGTGKSNAGVVLAEQMWKARLQFVVLDPKGDWWGMRLAADGQAPGIPIPVFGGLHGDLPLEPTAGKLLARLVMDHDLTAILDLSDFSKADQIRFAVAFAEELWRLIRRAPRTLHVVLEEADEFLPQTVRGEDAAMVGIYSKMSRQGRTLGLGVTLITQRSARLHKDALSQTENLVLFQTTSPHDLAAVNAWARPYPEAKEIAATLPFLEPGECWLLAPSIGIARRFRWNRRSTFDSGATPVPGERLVVPKSIGQVDLPEIEALMADTRAAVEADDPEHLRKVIAEHEATIARLEAGDDFADLEGELAEQRALAVEFERRLGIATAALRQVADLGETIATVARSPETTTAAPAPPPEIPAVLAEVALEAPSAPLASMTRPDQERPELKAAELDVLTALFQHGPLTAQRAGFMAGRSPGGGAFQRTLTALRERGLVQGAPLEITPAGRAALPGTIGALPTGEALVDYWLEKLPESQAEVLRSIIDHGPGTVDQLAQRLGRSAGGGSFQRTMTGLRRTGLVARGTPVRLAPEFQEAIDG